MRWLDEVARWLVLGFLVLIVVELQWHFGTRLLFSGVLLLTYLLKPFSALVAL